MIKFNDSVLTIFEEVRTLTKKSIKLIEKPDLSNFASVKIARSSMPEHLLYYKPESTGFINHLIAHECGHILRIFGVKPEKRLVPYTNDDLKMIALKDMEPDINRLSQSLPFKQLVQVANLWYHGLIKQLTNFPSDISIEKWIYEQYPDLRPFQFKFIDSQYDEAMQGLSNRVEKITPRIILKASGGMNYAYYKILALSFSFDYRLDKYKRAGYSTIGDHLVNILEGEQNNYQGDISTIENWADVLKISHWFSFKDFEDIPENYLNTFS